MAGLVAAKVLSDAGHKVRSNAGGLPRVFPAAAGSPGWRDLATSLLRGEADGGRGEGSLLSSWSGGRGPGTLCSNAKPRGMARVCAERPLISLPCSHPGGKSLETCTQLLGGICVGGEEGRVQTGEVTPEIAPLSPSLNPRMSMGRVNGFSLHKESPHSLSREVPLKSAQQPSCCSLETSRHTVHVHCDFLFSRQAPHLPIKKGPSLVSVLLWGWQAGCRGAATERRRGPVGRAEGLACHLSPGHHPGGRQ